MVYIFEKYKKIIIFAVGKILKTYNDETFLSINGAVCVFILVV